MSNINTNDALKNLNFRISSKSFLFFILFLLSFNFLKGQSEVLSNPYFTVVGGAEIIVQHDDTTVDEVIDSKILKPTSSISKYKDSVRKSQKKNQKQFLGKDQKTNEKLKVKIAKIIQKIKKVEEFMLHPDKNREKYFERSVSKKTLITKDNQNYFLQVGKTSCFKHFVICEENQVYLSEKKSTNYFHLFLGRAPPMLL